MTQLHKISVNLAKGQKEKIMRACKHNEEVIVRLAKNALSGNDSLMVPMSTVKKLAKHKNLSKGVEITFSRWT